tara:strand:- start:543 stop:662 length:120 start_codon:yes stop_codon:yes gene_type:complete
VVVDTAVDLVQVVELVVVADIEIHMEGKLLEEVVVLRAL